MDPSERAEALVRTTRSLLETTLRVALVRSVLLEVDVAELAPALDVLCARAERVDTAAREVMIPLALALQDPSCADVTRRLREEAIASSLFALERCIRQPVSLVPVRELPDPQEERIPDYGRGRPLTLGERKSLARRPTRETMDMLFRDPHPDVIRQVLGNPKVTEDDVLRLAARRPCRSDVLVEIARSPRWSTRPRIRVALVLNPNLPLESVSPLIGLLMRHELKLVAESTTVAAGVRALCLEHLERRPPVPFGDPPPDDDLLQ